MTEFERQLLACLMVKYQSQHDVEMSHLERTKWLKIASDLLQPLQQDRIEKIAENWKKLPF